MIITWDDDAWQQFQNLLLFGNIKDCKKIVKLIGYALSCFLRILFQLTNP